MFWVKHFGFDGFNENNIHYNIHSTSYYAIHCWITVDRIVVSSGYIGTLSTKYIRTKKQFNVKPKMLI